MRMNRLVVQILVTVLIVSCLGSAGAVESVMTVLPKGVVKVTEKSGQVVQLTTNFPLKEGAIMEVSGGPATVHGVNFSIIAQDKAIFSLNNVDGKWVCTVNAGKVNYMLHSDAMVRFVHAESVCECQEINPETPGGSVEGSAAGQCANSNELLIPFERSWLSDSFFRGPYSRSPPVAPKQGKDKQTERQTPFRGDLQIIAMRSADL